jgi:hypothetical protein
LMFKPDTRTLMSSVSSLSLAKGVKRCSGKCNCRPPPLPCGRDGERKVPPPPPRPPPGPPPPRARRDALTSTGASGRVVEREVARPPPRARRDALTSTGVSGRVVEREVAYLWG